MKNRDDPPLGDATLAARAGHSDSGATPPSSPAIYLTTAFDLQDLSLLDDVAAGRQPGYIYTRDGNPNQDGFASAIARLERAEAGVATASGMGAFTAVLLGLLKSGDHVVAGHALYGRTGQQLNHMAKNFGIEVSYVDPCHIPAVKAAIRPETRLCIAESVTNPLVAVVDIPELADACRGIPLLIDNTFATPALLKPISLGATYVWHSASKYLNGHGDVMQGVLVGPANAMQRIRAMVTLFGLNSNPMEAWLATRGLKTLQLRMQRVSQTAASLAAFLGTQKNVLSVYYPGLPRHATFETAKRDLVNGYGGMLAFELAGGRDAVNGFFRHLAGIIPFSPTLADVRTTLSYPAGTSHKFLTQAERNAVGISDGLVRLSVGLEDFADLQTELQRGLDAIVL